MQAKLPPKNIYVDATFGRGGHSRLILSRLPEGAQLIAFDKDVEAIAEAAQIKDAPGFLFGMKASGNLGELPDRQHCRCVDGPGN